MSKPVVYAAVLTDMLNNERRRSEGDDEKMDFKDSLHEPLLVVPCSVDGGEDEILRVVRRRTWRSRGGGPSAAAAGTCATCFLSGGVIGIAFSVVGFHLLLRHLADFTVTDILICSVAWSAVTSAAAYGLFLAAFGWCCRGQRLACDADENENPSLTLSIPSAGIIPLEHAFALGVFLGFCLACTATDVAYGLPFGSIAWTVAVAIGWALVMLYCAAATTYAEDSEEDSSPRRGTHLPLVVV